MLGPDDSDSTESKFRLLYLGNDLKLIAAVEQSLPEPEYRLVSCGDREGAELFLKSEIPYHLLLIDLDWREKEGLKILNLARSLKHRKRLPITLVSARRLTGEVQIAVQKAELKTVVIKSADMKAVTDAIHQLVER